eukprot:1807333-Rhodomonas_salina.2
MSHTWYGGGMHQGFQTMQTVPRGHSMPPSPQLTSLPPLYPSANIPSMHMSQHIQHAPYQVSFAIRPRAFHTVSGTDIACDSSSNILLPPL